MLGILVLYINNGSIWSLMKMEVIFPDIDFLLALLTHDNHDGSREPMYLDTS